MNTRKKVTSLYKSKVTVDRWYGTAIKLPTLNSRQFIPFVSSCTGLVSALYTRKFGEITIHSSRNVPTAYADMTNNKIVISENFLYGNFSSLGITDTMSGKDTAAAILGILTHEIGHFRHTPIDGLKSFVDYVQANTTRQFNYDLAQNLANIIEDIYIEYMVSYDFPTLQWTLQSINKLMLTDAKYLSAQKYLASVTVITNANRVNLINYLLFAKVTKHAGTVSSLTAKLFNLARSVVKTTTLEQRHVIVCNLYNLLMPPTIDTDSDNSDTPEDNESEDSGDDSDSEDSDSSESDSSESDSSESDSDEGDSTDSSESDDYSLDVKKIADDSDRPYIPQHTLRELKTSGILSSNGMTVRNIDVKLGTPLALNLRYSKLTEIARQRANISKPLGIPRNSGNNLHSLERIVIDGKIFSERQPSNNFQPMEIMIVIDCSGSMRGLIDGGDNTIISKFNSALQQSLGCAQAFVTARCNVQVWGHTSDSSYKNDLGIFKFKIVHEPISILAQRLGYIQAYPYQLSANRDGFAFDYLATKLPKGNRKRLMLIISDGQPSASNPAYEYESAILHTQERVNKIRTSGIAVQSLSIDRSAFSTNNRIYGENNNICSTDTDALDQLVKQILMA